MVFPAFWPSWCQSDRGAGVSKTFLFETKQADSISVGSQARPHVLQSRLKIIILLLDKWYEF